VGDIEFLGDLECRGEREEVDDDFGEKVPVPD